MRNRTGMSDARREYSCTYDACGRQTSKTDMYGTTTYEYDALGQITKVNMPGKTSEFTYDAANNRISMTEEYTEEKTFDSVMIDNSEGNVLKYKKKTVMYEYSDRNELLSAEEKMYSSEDEFVIGSHTAYTYDQNGNQYMAVSGLFYPHTDQEEGAEILAAGSNPKGYVSVTISLFDCFNRLSSITKTEGSQTVKTSYVYNGDGLRTQKTVLSGDTEKTTNYLYDGSHVAAESGDTTATYVRGLNYIAKIGVSNNIDYYLYNAHGDVTQVVDSAGTVKNQYDYDAFGETIVNEEGTENSIKYTGEFFDESAGLYYLRARYYNPGTGRFISEDTNWGDIKNPASLNLYTYCYNDPVTFIDPSGHASKPPAWLDWDGDGKIDTKEDRESFDRNHDYIADWNQSGVITGGSLGSFNPQSGADTVTNWSSISSIGQSNINSAYRAWKGGYITKDQYIENVKLNGGSLPSISFNVKSLGVTVNNYAKLSTVQQRHIAAGINAYSNGNIGIGELHYDLVNNGAVLSADVVELKETSSEYNGTGFASFEEFFAYSLIDPQGAEMILYHLNDTNHDYLGAVINDYINYQGGMQQGNPDIYQVIYNAVPGWTGGYNNRNLNLNNWEPGGVYNSDTNMYDNYEFSVFDALNWLIQSGGKGNFALQTRALKGLNIDKSVNLENINLAAAGQRHLVGKFMDATLFMRIAGVDAKPQLFIGSTEDDGSNAVDIYKNIMSTSWLQGNTDIIGGIYYGHEDSIDIDTMRSVSDFIHSDEQGNRKLIWIPYIDDDGERSREELVNEYPNLKDSAGNPLFDVIIIQPGAFYYKDKYKNEENESYLELLKNYVLSYYDTYDGSTSKVGIEMEFDMGVVTGRRIGTEKMDYLLKRQILIDYLNVFDELKGKGIPIGVYSGGPNEQGYNDIRFNRNSHNSGNHIPYWEGIDESAYAYGVYYDHFVDRYVGGNPIYDINNYLYNGIWSPALTDSLWLTSR